MMFPMAEDVEWVEKPPKARPTGAPRFSVAAFCALLSTRPGRWARVKNTDGYDPHQTAFRLRKRGYEAMVRGGVLYARAKVEGGEGDGGSGWDPGSTD